ncbi:MAG TPA: peptidoglycan-binding protein [Geminicoccus sp.]|uniref:peptidoglycan-binding protein n=1 Tax=Geminicoccus sp. TaxID=2024832 RepID=UPI002C4CDD9C|nr:peptidoglycan-binding protein [Geminicoccus sp.]HWL68252.1 peptidoglycan-binding protein [Geminicoccus sp.]
MAIASLPPRPHAPPRVAPPDKGTLGAAAVDALFPSGRAEHRQAFVRHWPALAGQYGLDAHPWRREFFLAQLGHESGGLAILEENLHYEARRLLAVFPRHFRTLEEAQACAAAPERLANRVYCDRMANGDEASGDGYRFRGRGYIQLTGRANYREIGRLTGLALEAQPDLARHPDHALHCAAAFWTSRGLNELADAGRFEEVTRRINGGLHGLEDRQAWLDKVRRVLAAPPAELLLDVPAVLRLQRALQQQGYAELGAADGQVGPRTLAAVARFRQDHGLGPGGIDRRFLDTLASV